MKCRFNKEWVSPIYNAKNLPAVLEAMRQKVSKP